MLMITETQKGWFSFTARGVNYEVNKQEDGFYQVWTQRKSLVTKTLKVMSKAEMMNGAKVLREAILFIEAEAVAV